VSARIIDGARHARTILDEVAADVRRLVAQGRQPGLAVVIVGEDPASQVYVRSKGKACTDAGMHSETIRLPADTSQAVLLETVDRLNRNPAIHGILVQLPLPKHLDEHVVLLRINPAKDVDGFHPVNVGKVAIGDATGFRPCTPYGVQQMLIREGIETSGAHAVVVGRSNIVGRPMASLLLDNGPGGNATVTVCHSRTRDLAALTRAADIIVVAIGKPEFLTADMVRDGVVVMDVGINRVPDETNARGYRLVGDVAFDAVAAKAAAITPVPGGVGRMTIAMLMKNTVQACEQLASRGTRDERRALHP
jgi:methylenetetrahydrofolate dehydrogenase (NADP+)/methenyltetrahydrofolate cyclohydrolase